MTAPARPPLTVVQPEAPAPPEAGAGLSVEYELGLTDARNAERFVTANPDLRYDEARRTWWRCDGSTWAPDTTGVVWLRAQGLAAQIYAAAGQADTPAARKALGKWARDSEQRRSIEAFLRLAQSRVPVRPDDFDRDPLRVNTTSGVFDVRTGELSPPDPAALHARVTGVPYVAEAPAPRWAQFLLEVFDGDEALVDYVQPSAGYALTGDTREQVFFLLHGTGANGKTTFVEALAHAFGTYARTTSFDAFLARDRAHAGPSPELTQLPGVRFAHASESSAAAAFAEHTLKLVTGGDQLEVRGPYQAPFTFTPQFKLWLLTNHRPHIRGRDHAIWRRVHLVPFLRTFAGEAKDPGLVERFALWRSPDLMVTVGRVLHEAGQVLPGGILVDAGGVGAGVADRLKQLRFAVEAVQFGGSASDPQRFRNRRAELYWGLRELLEQGKVSPPDDDELVADLTSVRYRFTQDGRVELEPKEELRKKLGRSPDRADALVLAVARLAQPKPVGGVITGHFTMGGGNIREDGWWLGNMRIRS